MMRVNVFTVASLFEVVLSEPDSEPDSEPAFAASASVTILSQGSRKLRHQLDLC